MMKDMLLSALLSLAVMLLAVLLFAASSNLCHAATCTTSGNRTLCTSGEGDTVICTRSGDRTVCTGS